MNVAEDLFVCEITVFAGCRVLIMRRSLLRSSDMIEDLSYDLELVPFLKGSHL